MIVISDHKTFYFNFHWPKDVDKDLNTELSFSLKSTNL